MDSSDCHHHAIMLEIAREAIGHRAAADGYDASCYDAEHDPEGYIISLLNALRQWCQVHEIAWEHELAQAREFSEVDTRGLTGGTPDPASIASVDVLRCPACRYCGGMHEFLNLPRPEK